MSATILVSAPTLAEAGQEVLRAEGCRVIFTSRQGGTEEMLQHLRRKAVDGVISRHGVGFDNVDIATATERGVPVLIAPAGNGQSVAELTMALMLAAARQVATQNAAIRAGNVDFR